MAVCSVQDIKAPNGNPSELFKEILDITGDQNKALGIWLTTKSQSFKNDFPGLQQDENGETLISEIYKEGTFILETDPDINDLAGYNNLKEIVIDKLDTAIRQKRGIYKKNGEYFLTSGKIVEGTKVLAEINRVGKFVRSSKIRGAVTEVHKIFIEDNNIKKFVDEFDDRDIQANEIEELNLSTNESINDLVEKPQKADKFTEVITRLRERKRILQLKRTEDPKRSSEIKAKIDNIDREIEFLRNKKSGSAIKEVARAHISEIQTHINLIERNLGDNLNSEQLLAFMDNLMENSYFIKGWLDADNLIPFEEGTELEDEVFAIKNEFDKLYKRYLKAQKELFIKYINLESYESEFTEDRLFSYISDTNRLTKNFLSSAASDSELVKVITDVLKNAEFLANQKMVERKNHIDSIIDLNKRITNLKGEEAWDWVIQKYKNGKKTGNLISPYKQEFFDERRERLDRAKETEEWGDYIAWLKENTDTITKEEAESGKSNIFNQEELDKQKELLEQYELDKKAYQQALEDRGLDERNIDIEMAIWEDIWSPYTYWKFISEDIRYKRGRQGYRYIVYSKPREKWHDATFKRYIMDINTGEISNKDRHYIYNETMKIFEDNNKKLPINYRQQRNYLPEQKKDLSFIETLKTAPDFIKKAFTEEAENDVETRIEIEGRIIKTVPVYMMDNKFDLQDKSYNVGDVLMSHSEMALSYEYKSKIQVVAEAGKDFLDEMQEAALNQNQNTYKRGIFGQVVLKDKKLYNTKEHLEYAINAYLYNEYKERGEFNTGKRILTSEDKKTLEELGISKKEIGDKIKEIKAEWTDGKITDREYYAALNRLNNIGRLVTGGAIGDTAIKWTYLKALAFPNIISPAVNMFFGTVSNHIYAASGVDFNTKELFKASSIMLAATSPKLGKKLHNETLNKVFAFMETLDLLGESIIETQYGGFKSLSDKAVFLQMHAEKVNQGSVMIAMLNHQKIKDKNGNEVSLWNAYKVDSKGNLVWDTELMGEQGEVSKHDIINKEGNAVNLYRFGLKMGSVVARIHGDYKSPMAMKANVINRVVMLFRTWLPASIEERFGKERYDQELGRVRRGRYGSFVNPKDTKGNELGFTETLKTLLRIISFQQNKYGDISDVDIENIKKDLREIVYIAGLYVTSLMFKALLDDDDEKREILYALANTHGKVMADLMFALNPGSASQILDNVVPIYRTINDFFAITEVTQRALAGDLYYQNGYWKDRLRIEKWLYSNLPGASSAVRMYGLSQQLYDYN